MTVFPRRTWEQGARTRRAATPLSIDRLYSLVKEHTAAEPAAARDARTSEAGAHAASQGPIYSSDNYVSICLLTGFFAFVNLARSNLLPRPAMQPPPSS